MTEFDPTEVPSTPARPQSPPPVADPQGHGALNPLAASRRDGRAWQILDGLWVWMLPDGSVALQSDQTSGEVIVPAQHLALLARSLLAAHVQNGRPEFRGQQ